MSTLADRLARLIASSGPISVAEYMAAANAHYYASRDPLGAAGDFTTAPEISQMFGELVGLWLADMWGRAGKPVGARYVELGPGRGTLSVDALRAMASVGLKPEIDFVETSPVLRAAQAERVPGARWHDDTEHLPGDAPLLVVANEFFDALPVRQLVAGDGGWRERMVDHRDGRFVPVPGARVPGQMIPPEHLEALDGAVIEASPASVAIVRDIAARLADQGGAALIIDYGYDRPGVGDTLQAVARHGYADPWAGPGEHDLTAHVDFPALAQAARSEDVRVLGPVTQGEWLGAMGIEMRAAALARSAPARADEIAAARARLTEPEQMGTLFKAMALVAPDWPGPAGFS